MNDSGALRDRWMMNDHGIPQDWFPFPERSRTRDAAITDVFMWRRALTFGVLQDNLGRLPSSIR